MSKLLKYFYCSTLSYAAIFTFCIISCCRDNVPENPYKWEIERWENVYLDPYYENGYYYVFSEDWDTHQSYLTKIKEIDGEIIYSTPFKVGADLDLRRSSSTFNEGDRLMFVEGKYIHQFNKNTGQLTNTDEFTNYIWNFQWTKDHLTACSYKSDLSTFKYYEIIYENGKYSEKSIHEEYQDNQNNAFVNGGTPPVFANGKWMMAYVEGNKITGETKNYLIIKDGEKINKQSVGYDNNKGSGFAGPLLVDDNAMYVYCVDKLFAFDRNNQFIKWSTDIVGSGLNRIIGDYIYTISASSVEKMTIINKNTGEAETIDSRSAWSGQVMGDYLCWSQGDFYKFNSKTRTVQIGPMDEEADQGYWDYSIGVSPNSKLLFDMKRWVCFPF